MKYWKTEKIFIHACKQQLMDAEGLRPHASANSTAQKLQLLRNNSYKWKHKRTYLESLIVPPPITNKQWDKKDWVNISPLIPTQAEECWGLYVKVGSRPALARHVSGLAWPAPPTVVVGAFLWVGARLGLEQVGPGRQAWVGLPLGLTSLDHCDEFKD